MLNSNPIFVVKDNVKYYKNEPVEVVVREILNGMRNIDDYPGFNIRFGEVYYHNKNILTDEIYNLTNEIFVVKNNVEMVLIDGKYIPWKYYKNKLLEENIEYNEFYEELKISYPQAIILPTGLKQQGDSKQYFEKLLVENNIEWFTYIKFYEKDDKLYPIQCCKSGSKLVNKSGSDLHLRIDNKDGAARRFLRENNYEFHWRHVIVIPAGSEEEAYEIEKEIQNRFGLFG